MTDRDAWEYDRPEYGAAGEQSAEAGSVPGPRRKPAAREPMEILLGLGAVRDEAEPEEEAAAEGAVELAEEVGEEAAEVAGVAVPAAGEPGVVVDASGADESVAVVAEGELVAEAVSVAEPEPVAEGELVAGAEAVVEAEPVAEAEAVVEGELVAEAEAVAETVSVAEPEPVAEPVAEAEASAAVDSVVAAGQPVIAPDGEPAEGSAVEAPSAADAPSEGDSPSAAVPAIPTARKSKPAAAPSPLPDPVDDATWQLSTDMAPLPPLRQCLEAILLVVEEPVAEVVLAQITERPRDEVAQVLQELSAEYTAQGRGFDLRQVAGGWRFYTRAACAPLVEKFVLDGQQARLSTPALETLAVVAYRQPVSRSRISAVRGVNCDGVMRTLLTRGLVEEAGSDAESGAILYRTTPYFLERMGMQSLDELPELAPLLPSVEAMEEAESLA